MTTTTRYKGQSRLIIMFLAVSISFCGLVEAQSKGSTKTKGPTKEIAITFDELPAARGFGEVDRDAVNYLILDALKQHEVKAIGFVVGQELGDSFDLLGRWLNEGHRLGSMTFSNQDINYIGPESFIDEIQRGLEAIEPMLSGFGQKPRYFRYPFLHYGTTESTKRMVSIYLDEINHYNVPASVVPEDYLYNLMLEKLGREPDSAAFIDLMNEYVNHIFDEIERVDQLALDIENRAIKHILQLRANRLNAVYLNDLLTALEDAGFKFITIEQALKDRVYSRPEAYFGMKGLGYLDRIIQSETDRMSSD